MYNVTIIGAGNKGALSDIEGTGNEHKYISYAHAIVRHKGFNLLGFIDINWKNKNKAIKNYGGKDICCFYKNCKCCKETYDNTDIFIISTYDSMHYINLMQILKFNPKLVICEKPLCNNFDEAEYIIELYKEKNIPILVDYTREFIPEFQEIIKDVNSGNSGKFIKGYLYYNRGLLHTATHFISLVLKMNGSLENIEIIEIDTEYQWVFQWGLFYTNTFYSENSGKIENKDVDPMFDNNSFYVMNNAYNFLQGTENLICTGEMALKTLKECFKIKLGGKYVRD